MMQEFVQAVRNMVKKELEGLHTACPGVIVSFDSGKGVATVQPKMKFKKPNGETVDYPQIHGVPVAMSGGSGSSIAFPIKPGDGCLIVFAEQSLDYWMYGQETDTDLPFDLSNAVAIPGLSASPSSDMQEASDSNSVIVRMGGTTMKLSDSGIELSASNVKITGNLDVGGAITGG